MTIAAPSAPANPPGVVLRGAWGSDPGPFGRRRAQEGNPEVPMALAVDAHGDVTVLDQVHRRAQRFQAGRLSAVIDLAGEGVQDVATLPGGGTAVLDRLGTQTVALYDGGGRPLRTIPLTGGAIAEGGAVTGLFADTGGVYVEREHREVVRLASADGEADGTRPTLWGRPSRDGRTLLRAGIQDGPHGAVYVSVADRSTGAMDWTRSLALDGAALQIVLLDGDHAGAVYLGAVVATMRGATPEDAHVTVVRLDTTGTPTGTLRLPAPPASDEVFRAYAVGDDGTVYAMVPGDDGLEVRAYRLGD